MNRIAGQKLGQFKSVSPYPGACMRVLRYIGAALAILASGWLLLGYHGLSTSLKDRSNGWQIYELPSHPFTRMLIFLMLGLALPFLSARLTAPSQTATLSEVPPRAALWPNYLVRLIISFAAAFVVAFMLALLLMALLDAGVI
jgi:hypothetical protein